MFSVPVIGVKLLVGSEKAPYVIGAKYAVPVLLQYLSM